MKESKSSKDPELKGLLAVGGQDYAIRKANEMMSKNDSRQKFVISTTKLLRTHEFDGIDLNFEPSEALGPPSSPNPQLVEDKKKLTMLCKVKTHDFELFSYSNNRNQFLQDLQEEYAEEAGRTGRARLLLSITVSGIRKDLESRFELDELAK